MPTLVPVDHNPFADDGPTGQSQGAPQVAPSSLPSAGMGTPASGNPMAGFGVTPPYQTDEDFNQIGLAAALGERNRGVIQAIQNTPGHQARIEYSKHVADDQADLGNTQRGVIPMLKDIDALETRIRQAGPDVASLAIGPDYTPADQKDSGFLHNTLSDLLDLGTGIATGDRGVAFQQDTGSNAFQSKSAKMYGSGDPANPNNYDKAADLNNELQHFKEGIATAFKAIPGSGKAGSTDQAQATLSEMINAGIHSRNPETLFRILHAAKNIVRGLGNFPEIPEPQSFIPQQWQKPQPGSPPAAASLPPPQPSRFKYLGKVQ